MRKTFKFNELPDNIKAQNNRFSELCMITLEKSTLDAIKSGLLVLIINSNYKNQELTNIQVALSLEYGKVELCFTGSNVKVNIEENVRGDFYLEVGEKSIIQIREQTNAKSLEIYSDYSKIDIGKCCLFDSNTIIQSTLSGLDKMVLAQKFSKDIFIKTDIEDNVVIGESSIIYGGVKIGGKSKIAKGSVINCNHLISDRYSIDSIESKAVEESLQKNPTQYLDPESYNNEFEDAIYSSGFFENQKEGSKRSSEIILEKLFDQIGIPNSVIDFGCGTGIWLDSAKNLGTNKILGIDGPQVIDHLDIEMENYLQVDFEDKYDIPDKFDLALCLEVIEHLSYDAGIDLVQKLCSTSDIVLFSAAVPYQGGTGHLNENWLEYWVEQFKSNNYIGIDSLRNILWNNNKVEWWYKQNLVVFISEKNEILSNFSNIEKESIIRTLIHPENYINAVYKQSPDKGPFDRSKSTDLNYYHKILENNTSIEMNYGQDYDYTHKS